MNLAGLRVTVMGLGRFGGGVGVARYLIEQGADVLVTDIASREQLGNSLEQLAGLPIAFRLGEHNVSDFTTCDLVIANPAVPPGNRFLRAAKAAGIPITTELRLLVENLPAREKIIGVTGSAGKSTTCAMIAHALQKTQKVWLGGNIGGSLLGSLGEISADDWVVLELSSFMLENLREEENFRGWSPHIALVTNFSSNHLDWHGSIDHYRAAKQVIYDYQRKGDIALAGPGVEAIFESSVGLTSIELAPGSPFQLLLPGSHNQVNAQLAAAVLNAAAGMSCEDCAAAFADFAGLPHRLAFVGERGSVRCFNDSKSTTPAAAMLAIESFKPGAVRVILGGYDKGSDLTDLALLAGERCAAVYTIGQTGQRLAEMIGPVAQFCDDLHTAATRAIAEASPGDVVLLSPGCASWDQFDNYEQRGEAFIRLWQQAGV